MRTGARYIARLLQQVRADRGDAVVPGERGVGAAASSWASAASGPSTIASATIRLSVTIGPGASAASTS